MINLISSTKMKKISKTVNKGTVCYELNKKKSTLIFPSPLRFSPNDDKFQNEKSRINNKQSKLKTVDVLFINTNISG
jgi:hypothetical protein